MRLRRALEPLRSRVPRSLRWEPWSVLVPLVLLHWLAVAYVARHAHHNGWLYYHDRAATRVYTTAWLVGEGHLPLPFVGHGVPLLLAPITWIAGASSLDALPVVIALQVALVLPLLVLVVYGLGARTGGRLVGYGSAAVWALLPLVSQWYFPGRGWLDQTLPALFGLTELQYLPSLFVVAVAGVLALRTLDDRRWTDAVAAGAAAGFAVAIEPTNIVFVAAPLVTLAAVRRWRELGAFTAALAPCLLTYLLWRQRGLGHIGNVSQLLLLPGPTSFHFSWQYTLQVRFTQLQTSSWSPRVLEWIAIAGVVALAKRVPVKALFLGTWVLAYVLVGGKYRAYAGDNVAYWHIWLPALPAFAVLLASLPLLWPHADRRLVVPYAYRPRRLVPYAVPALAAAAIVVPLVVVAALPVLRDQRASAEVKATHEVVPLDRGVRAHAVADGRGVTLSWAAVEAPAEVTYTVYRTPAAIECPDARGATRCVFAMTRLGTTHKTSFTDAPPGGAFTYRVAMTANYLPDKRPGSTILVGPPVRVRTS